MQYPPPASPEKHKRLAGEKDEEGSNACLLVLWVKGDSGSNVLAQE